MKKSIIGSVLVMVLILTLGVTSIASADSTTPAPQSQSCSWLDNLLHNDQCQSGRMRRNTDAGEGILHDYILEQFAEKLGISSSALETRLDTGESMYAIAVAEGMTASDFITWMQSARTKAIEQAVTDGILTSEQAEWMTARGGMIYGELGGTWSGMRGSMQNGRMGRFGGQNCPMLP